MTSRSHNPPDRRILPQGHVWIDPIDDADDLPLGAHLVTPRRSYTHHGIYVGTRTVVHYAGLCWQRSRGPVEEVTVAEFAHGQPLAVVPRPLSRYRGASAVARARSRLGEDAYNLLTNNCEHFCNWCLDGHAYSEQVEALMALPGRLLERMLVRLARA